MYAGLLYHLISYILFNASLYFDKLVEFLLHLQAYFSAFDSECSFKLHLATISQIGNLIRVESGYYRKLSSQFNSEIWGSLGGAVEAAQRYDFQGMQAGKSAPRRVLISFYEWPCGTLLKARNHLPHRSRKIFVTPRCE